MQRASGTIYGCVKPVVTGMGYELVGVEYGGGPGNGRLRVYIDCPDGITVDDCAAVSEQLSAALDVDDPIPDAYALEVSSPGLNRPLFERSDFERFRGARVFVRLGQALEGRKRFKGQLVDVEADAVRVEVDGRTWSLPLDSVEQAHLVADV
ncbi:MAG: ribosome maturation factor RimP [Halofilum sp. (in: g-proteobacteria)]|nr:ribosome maturation factor RimP [Halofilum sp. (in: g-proteobacteria)]